MNPKGHGKIGSTGKVAVFRILQLFLVNSVFNIVLKFCNHGSHSSDENKSTQCDNFEREQDH